ncbi:MAG: cupin domain-containing protein [Chitinophagaceae bacterium]
MNYFIELGKIPLKEITPGIKAEILQTQNLTIGYSFLKMGSVIPRHHHPEEAIDIMIEGELEMSVGDKTEIIRPGMMILVPSDIPHEAKALTDCRVVSVFYPRREIRR